MTYSYRIGEKFGRLTIMSPKRISLKTGHKVSGVWCKCRCGVETFATITQLKSGHKTSCGCYWREKITKHAKWGTPAYNAYRSMLQRCFNAKNPCFHRYGGRGITVCDRWKKSFNYFLEDMGEPLKRMSLDRINNNGNYSPENCRWASIRQQSLNTRRNHRLLYNGENLTIKEWSEKMGFPRELLRSRIKRGWTIARAITTKKGG